MDLVSKYQVKLYQINKCCALKNNNNNTNTIVKDYYNKEDSYKSLQVWTNQGIIINETDGNVQRIKPPATEKKYWPECFVLKNAQYLFPSTYPFF